MGTDLHEFHQGQARRLIPLFMAWKALLILLAVLCPGPGYDTSGLILLSHGESHRDQFQSSSFLDRLALSHVRWDALYFVKAAQRGYVYEQEWAFSRAYSLILGIAKDCLWGSEEASVKPYIWTGILISNLFHLFSVLALYRLARACLGPQQNPRIPFIASALHILSPAGLFLSAPYAESLFSALHFNGMLAYVNARQTVGTWGMTHDLYMLSSGILFACATCVRSNGLLSGLIFLYDVACYLPRLLTFQLNVHQVRRLFVTCAAGGILAMGYIIPQIVAYEEYCQSGHDNRPWCHEMIPSIYSWVQKQYWNVGFLQYWTFSNLPLFLLAAPMLWLLSTTSISVLRGLLRPSIPEGNDHSPDMVNPSATKLEFCQFPQLAIPQLVLTVAAATNFHVQIINRISSGYPLWYLVVAKWVTDRAASDGVAEADAYAQRTIRGMVVYTIIQGLLFASFLPPA